jgi:hypothetical protein
MRTKLIVGGGVAIATALAGCGDSGSNQTQTVVTVIEKTVQAPAPATSDAPTSSGEAGTTAAKPAGDTTSTPIVPDVSGQRLDVAELHLRAKHIRFREVGGGTFGIVVRSNWTVCEQEPQAGTTTDGRVSLIVDRECE